MKSYPYVILGGGIVAGYGATEFVARGVAPGALAIVSAAANLPYERPPLSKTFLRGEERLNDIRIHEPSFYEEHGIAFYGESRVTAVDFSARTLTIEGAPTLGFEKLIIATGARVRTLDVPGADHEAVHYLRSVQDARQIRRRSRACRRVVVIGSGFIGMEAAASLRRAGLDVSLVFPERRVWQRFFTPVMSAALAAYYAERGVQLYPDSTVTGIETTSGRLTAVTLASGQRIPADFVVAGIGVVPNTALFTNTPLRLDDGVVVDETLQSNIDGVYAAGDVARYWDVNTRAYRRDEHWDNAVRQGEYVARRCLGKTAEPYRQVPYFFSDIFDLSYEFWGETEGADEIVYRGALSALQFSVWWLRDGRVQGAFVMDRPDSAREKAEEWVRDGCHVDPRRLANGTPLQHVALASGPAG